MKALFLLIACLPALAEGAVPLKGSGGEVTFLAVGKPSMLKIHGKAADPVANLIVDGATLSGTAEVDMEKFGTGIKLRDQHMKEKYLATKEHPKAVLTLDKVKVAPDFATTLSSPESPFTGSLRFHGKEQPVKGTFAVTKGQVNAKFPLTLTDYGVEVALTRFRGHLRSVLYGVHNARQQRTKAGTPQL